MHKIAIISIAIGLAAAIVSFLIMQGFQSAVKNKIYGFSNHLLITKYTMSNAVEEQPFDFHIALYKDPSQFGFVQHIQEFSHKAGIIKTDEEVMGIVFKGVGKSFDVSQFKTSLQGERRHLHDLRRGARSSRRAQAVRQPVTAPSLSSYARIGRPRA